MVSKLFYFSYLKIKLILLPFHFHNRILFSATIESIKNFFEIEIYLRPILNQGFSSYWAALQGGNGIHTQCNILFKHIILIDYHKYLLLFVKHWIMVLQATNVTCTRTAYSVTTLLKKSWITWKIEFNQAKIFKFS